MNQQLKEAIAKEAEKHAFRVPYNGTNDFYDKEKYKSFIAGAEYLAERSAGVWTPASTLPEIVDKKSFPKHVKHIRKNYNGKEYEAIATAYYFPDRFKTVEWEDWDDYTPEDFPYTEEDENAGVVWLRAGWYSSIDCDKCDGYWSAPLNVTHWLDPNPSWQAQGSEVEEWKDNFESVAIDLRNAIRVLREVQQLARRGIFPHLPVEVVGAQMCIDIDKLIQDSGLVVDQSTLSEQK